MSRYELHGDFGDTSVDITLPENEESASELESIGVLLEAVDSVGRDKLYPNEEKASLNVKCTAYGSTYDVYANDGTIVDSGNISHLADRIGEIVYGDMIRV